MLVKTVSAFLMFLAAIPFLCKNSSPIDRMGKKSQEIIDELILEMSEKYGLVASCSGLITRPEVKKFTVSFQSTESKSVDEGVQLFDEIASELLKKVNEKIAIRPFLSDYPVGMDSIDLALSFFSSSKHLGLKNRSQFIICHKGDLVKVCRSDRKISAKEKLSPIVYEYSYMGCNLSRK